MASTSYKFNLIKHGRTLATELMECNDDSHAMQKAKELLSTSTFDSVEVWQDTLRVGVVDLSDQQKAYLNRDVRGLPGLSEQVRFELLIRRKSEDLRICYVIAQRVKHHTLRPRVDDPTISVTVSVVPAWTISQALGIHDTIDDRTIERAKVVIAGSSRAALEVFEGAQAFWLEFLKDVATQD